MLPDHEKRVGRARLSLDGLSIGDAFGELFFGLGAGIQVVLNNRILPLSPWEYTDDTVMALSIVEVLEACGEIDQGLLAGAFAAKYTADTARGYGPGAHVVLTEIANGREWMEASRDAFGGEGSLGNGGAMRVAPLGAYFEGDPMRAVAEAERSAEITHSHLEGRAGAIAVAVAASTASTVVDGDELLDTVVEYTPDGSVRDGLLAALEIPLEQPVQKAAAALGNGSEVTATDTVPFCIWCAARHLGDFEEAMWQTVTALGDRDTTCAIVGGIVSLSIDGERLPESWLTSREPLEVLSGLGINNA